MSKSIIEEMRDHYTKEIRDKFNEHLKPVIDLAKKDGFDIVINYEPLPLIYTESGGRIFQLHVKVLLKNSK